MPVRVVVLARAARRVVVRKSALDEDVVGRGKVDLGEVVFLELLLRRLRQDTPASMHVMSEPGATPQLPDDVREVVEVGSI
eukprot:4540383-Prymnesium_polylepis.1